MNKIPDSFKIAGITFKVDKVDNIKNGSRYGEFNDCNNTIKIANRVLIDDVWTEVPELNKLNTFYHALMHAFNYYYNNECSESLAQVFANFMIEFEQTKNENL